MALGRHQQEQEIRRGLVDLLADMLVEDYQQFPNLMAVTAKTPGEIDRSPLEAAKTT